MKLDISQKKLEDSLKYFYMIYRNINRIMIRFPTIKDYRSGDMAAELEYPMFIDYSAQRNKAHFSLLETLISRISLSNDDDANLNILADNVSGIIYKIKEFNPVHKREIYYIMTLLENSRK